MCGTGKKNIISFLRSFLFGNPPHLTPFFTQRAKPAGKESLKPKAFYSLLPLPFPLVWHEESARLIQPCAHPSSGLAAVCWPLFFCSALPSLVYAHASSWARLTSQSQSQSQPFLHLKITLFSPSPHPPPQPPHHHPSSHRGRWSERESSDSDSLQSPPCVTHSPPASFQRDPSRCSVPTTTTP